MHAQGHRTHAKKRRYTKIWRGLEVKQAAEQIVSLMSTIIGPCTECGRPITPLHPGEQIAVGKWRHKPLCLKPAGEPFPHDSGTRTSTGGKTHKQHRDDNVKLPPKRPTR